MCNSCQKQGSTKGDINVSGWRRLKEVNCCHVDKKFCSCEFFLMLGWRRAAVSLRRKKLWLYLLCVTYIYRLYINAYLVDIPVLLK